MLKPEVLKYGAFLGLLTGLINSCASPSSEALATDAAERRAEREASLNDLFPGYPAVDSTYLSYDFAHGYQVTYYESPNRSWLWYPGNRIALPAAWKLDGEKVCWRYGGNTYNPATKEDGGNFSCTSKTRSLFTKVGVLSGDVFGLASGEIPYVRAKCDAPDQFQIVDDFATYAVAADCAPDPQ